MKTEIRFFKISNSAFAGEKLPTRLKLLNWGENSTLKGPVRIGNKTVAVFAANQKAAGFDQVALDYEHNTVPGTPENLATKEPRKVASYGAPRVIAGDGLYLEDLQYTPSGTENAREFIDLSPAVQLDKQTGEVVFMHSAALCRQGAVEDLSFYSVDLPAVGGNRTDQTDRTDRTATNNQEDAVYKKKLAALLALNAEATDDQIDQALAARLNADSGTLTALTAQVGDLKTQIGALSASAVGASANRGSVSEVVALTAKVAVLEGNVTKFSAELESRDRSALCDQAGREGKVIPLTAEQIVAMPIPVLKDMIVKLPVTVPLTALTVAGLREQPAGNVTTENDRKIAAACGIKLAEQK